MVLLTEKIHKENIQFLYDYMASAVKEDLAKIAECQNAYDNNMSLENDAILYNRLVEADNNFENHSDMLRYLEYLLNNLPAVIMNILASITLVINQSEYQFYPIAIVNGDFGITWIQGKILGHDATLKINPLTGECGIIQLDTDKYNHSEYFYML